MASCHMLHRLPHVAVLVLLAASARARIIPADAFATVADRLGFLFALAAPGDGVVLLGSHAGAGHRAGGRLVDRRAYGPNRFLKAFLFFHAENSLAHLVADALPHAVELLHALPLVLGLWIDLGVTDQADARAQMIHRVEMVFPRRIELAEQQTAFHAAHFLAIAVVEGVPECLACLLFGHAG